MDCINIGIYLKDREFAGALARGLAGECRRMNFHLAENGAAAEGFDLFVSDLKTGENVIFLVDDPEDECFDEGKRFSVFRYRDSFSFVSCLNLAYLRISGRMLSISEGRKTRLVVFASAAGGSGTTSLAIGTSKTLRRLYGVKCLYLNLCPVNDAGKYLNMEAGNHLLKLLYALSFGREVPAEMFVTRGEGLDYVSTDLFNTYFDQMEPKCLGGFLQQLEKSGEYDILLCDIGNFICRGNKEMLSAADRVVLVFREDFSLPEDYLQQVLSAITERAGEGRVIPVINCAGSQWEEKLSRAQGKDTEQGLFAQAGAIRISKDADGFEPGEDGLVRLNLMRNYGMEISVIARTIYEEEGEPDFR